MSVDGIAEQDSMPAIPKSNRVKKNPSSLFFKDLVPVLASVRRSIDTRLVLLSRAGTHDERRLVVEGTNAAEVEFLGAGHNHHRPGFAAIDGLDHRAAGAAGPNPVRTHRAKPAQAGGGGDGHFCPLRGSRDSERQNQ